MADQTQTNRAPAGDADSAIDGTWPQNIAIGGVGRMGMSWHDDFMGRSGLGEKNWSFATSGSGAAFPVNVNGLDHECGVFRVRSVLAGDESFMYQNQSFFRRGPPIGAMLEVKITFDISVATVVAWAGLQDSSRSSVPPITGNDADFIGFRFDAAFSQNWHGVVRNGTAEGAPLDMGVVGSTSPNEYARLGVRRLSDGSYEFYTFERSDDIFVAPPITIVGNINTNHPDEGLAPVIGHKESVAGARGLRIDYYTLGGRCVR